MEFNTKQELYNYLNNFDFDSVKDAKLSNVYFLVEYDGHREPIYFMPFEDVWFGFPCCCRELLLEDDKVMDYVKELYYEDSWGDAYEYEKNMQRNGYHYDIDCPQCPPFLPDNIKIQDVFSDTGCLDWLLDQRNNISNKDFE